MLPFPADSIIVTSHAEFRLSQFLLLQIRGTLYEPVQEYENSSGVGKIKNSDLVFAMLSPQFSNLSCRLRRIWKRQIRTMKLEKLYDRQSLGAASVEKRVQELFAGGASIRFGVKVNRPIHFLMVYL